MWCKQKRKFSNGQFDVPDFMHVQGLYETSMYTKAYDSIDQKIEAMSRAAGTQEGTASFSEVRKDFEKTHSHCSSLPLPPSLPPYFPLSLSPASVRCHLA